MVLIRWLHTLHAKDGDGTGAVDLSAKVRRELGDDYGCFVSALTSVRRYGGVLEHPEASHAWAAYGPNRPPYHGGWIRADEHGYTCCIAQGNYGHKARKLTWLYAVMAKLPVLNWSHPASLVRLDRGYHSAEERRNAVQVVGGKRLTKHQNMATPHEFRNLLLEIAGSVNG